MTVDEAIETIIIANDHSGEAKKQILRDARARCTPATWQSAVVACLARRLVIRWVKPEM